MADRLLPEPFSDLEPWMAWCLATESERSARRRASSMAELEAFYAAMLARMDQILPYLEQFPPDEVPADTQRLAYLTLSLAEVAPAVELFGEPTVTYGYDVARFEPGPE